MFAVADASQAQSECLLYGRPPYWLLLGTRNDPLPMRIEALGAKRIIANLRRRYWRQFRRYT